MRQIIILSLICCLFYSCSKKEDPQIEAIACFTLAKDTINYGETIAIKDCSENSETITYRLNNTPITLEELLATKQESGNKTIIQIAISETGSTKSEKKDFYVRPRFDAFHYPSELTNYYRLLDFGVNPILETIYTIYRDDADNKYYYATISENLELTPTEIKSRTQNTGYDRALTSFSADGVVYTDIPYATAVTLQRVQIWVNPTTGESDDPISLVSYDFDSDYTTYNNQEYASGANLEYDENGKKYIPSINKLIAGNSILVKEFDFGEKSGVIGNIMPYKNGVLAYAFSFDLQWGPDDYGFSNIKPMLLELDSEFNLITAHDLTIVGEDIYSTIPSFNARFHMKQLPNNKILLYGLGTLRILNNDLSVVYEEALYGKSHQSLLLLDDAFILSQDRFIKKFDFDGNLLAEFNYDQGSTYGILPYKNNIIFMSEVISWNTGEPEGGSLFFGVLDKDLNLINLNE